MLARALEDNDALRHLNLSSSKLRAGGAALFADSLRRNTCLQLLDLSRNNIGDKGAQALAAMMAECSLTRLDLSHNNVRATGASELASRIGTSRVCCAPTSCCSSSLRELCAHGTLCAGTMLQHAVNAQSMPHVRHGSSREGTESADVSRCLLLHTATGHSTLGGCCSS